MRDLIVSVPDHLLSFYFLLSGTDPVSKSLLPSYVLIFLLMSL